VDSGKMETTSSTVIPAAKSSAGLDHRENIIETEASENCAALEFLESALMSCRDGLCWNDVNNVTIPMNMSSYDQVLNPFSPSMSMSMSMSKNVVEQEDCYAFRWKGHLPLAPMPSTDSLSPNKSSLKRRSVR